MRIGKYPIPTIRKALVAWILAIVALVVTIPQIFSEWLDQDVVNWINVGVAVLTAIGVFMVRNAALIDSMGVGRPQDGLGNSTGLRDS